ncbi:Mycothiol acetyltransferase [compost metagenome]
MTENGEGFLMIQIRLAGLEDAKDLGLVQSESYRNAYKDIMPDEFLREYTPISRESYFNNALSKGTEHIAIMLVDNKTVGFLILKACSDNDLDDSYGEISAIYLLQHFRGKGFGIQLFNWGIEKLINLGFSSAALWVLKENKNAIGLYGQQEFVPDGTERVIFRGRELSQIRYQKRIVQ